MLTLLSEIVVTSMMAILWSPRIVLRQVLNDSQPQSSSQFFRSLLNEVDAAASGDIDQKMSLSYWYEWSGLFLTLEQIWIIRYKH